MDNIDEIMENCYRTHKFSSPYKVLHSHAEKGNIYKLSKKELIELLITMDGELCWADGQIDNIRKIIDGE